MSITRHHTEWLSLVELSGPFLSMPVLLRALPQGLDAHDPEHLRLLRLAHAEWEEGSFDPALHRAWIRFVLAQTLELPDDVLAEGQAVPPTLRCTVAEHGETLRPDLAVMQGGKALLLVHALPAGQDVDRPLAERRWKASPATRMMELLHGTDVRLGLVTNGERWTLVDAPRGETTGFASWYASYWLEEPITLRAFRTLLSARRFFSVPEDETLTALLAESATNQQDVTDQLGYQVRRAVEVLIQALDRADRGPGPKLLGAVPEARLYEAALTVMMRLVFLFSAEERGLLLLGDPLYDQHYAVSTLREQLREEADRHGEEVLERRLDAWVRLLSTFRAVHAGAEHHRLTLPAYGGHLFDPDSFPFLEGRERETRWRETPATPLPVNNRTVLHLLEALQVLQVKVPGGGPAEARRLSFRALDVEQIGHVYEGLLDHTARRAREPHLGLTGTRDREPEVALAELERLRGQGEKDLHRFLKKATGRSEPALRKASAQVVEGLDLDRFRMACDNDPNLLERVIPFAGLVRRDTFGIPVVIPTGSVYVTEGTDRRSSGTHYTPRSLTEPIVQYTLEPLVFDGPAEGKPREAWRLKSARDLLALKVCDMATGSGAFLVQACRYLSERLLEALGEAERAGAGQQEAPAFGGPASAGTKAMPRIMPFGDVASGRLDDQLIPEEAEDRMVDARREVAQRCLYGVDKNATAVEMAKLSLWLLTLAKGKPFTFLDHAIRCGDSLLGVHDLKQIEVLHLSGDKAETPVFVESVPRHLREAAELRQRIEEMRVATVADVEEQERLLYQAEEKTDALRSAADLLIAQDLGAAVVAQIQIAGHIDRWEVAPLREFAARHLGSRPTFHWPLEFPEVFARGGFDAIVGNPPFMGGKKITGNLGDEYREYLVRWLARGQRGHADLCAYFFLRARQLLRLNSLFGLLATNTVAQGDTREVGLDQLTAEGLVLPRAVSSQKWPGSANLEVAHVWGRRGSWSGPFILNDRPASGITPFLTQRGSVGGKPQRLKANEGRSFIGCFVYGSGFVLSTEEAQRLIDKDKKNKDVLFPYLNGEDLNSRPDQSASRWVINFFDWPIERAREYPECFRIVEEKVKPERATKAKDVANWPWWRYWRSRPELFAAIAGLDRVLVCAQTSRLWEPDFVSTEVVCSHSVVVFPLSEWKQFAAMQASFHEYWRLEYGPSLRTDARYTPSDCFETFPFPDTLPSSLDQIGDRYHTHRRQIMLTRQEGLTKTYNRFHDRAEASEDIARLRELHVAMDQAVAAAYGWTDLDLGHGFHQTRQGLRYTFSEAARQEVLARLLTLNHQRYADEVKAGLHEQKRATGRSRGRGSRRDAGTEPSLYEEGG